MAASRSDVNRWIETAKETGIKFIISVCDTFDYDDYPAYCKDFKELEDNIAKYEAVNMQKINEIIFINSADGSVKENISISEIKKMLEDMRGSYEISLLVFVNSKTGEGGESDNKSIIPFNRTSDSDSTKEALKDVIGQAIDMVYNEQIVFGINKIIINKCKKI